MDLEPVLLETALRAVLYLLTLALRTPVVGDELLLELMAVPLHEPTPLVFFRRFFQRAHFIFALRNVYHFFVGRFRYLMAVSYTHLRAHETKANLVCRLLLEKKK